MEGLEILKFEVKSVSAKFNRSRAAEEGLIQNLVTIFNFGIDNLEITVIIDKIHDECHIS